MARNTRLVSIKNKPMLIFEAPEVISDDIVKYNNFWEFEIFDKFKKHFPSEGLMLDIGANIGCHCVQFNHYFPNLKIWAFEPYPPNYELLSKNIEMLDNIHGFNLGIGSENSMVYLGNEWSQNCGSVKVLEKEESWSRPYSNMVLALDTIKLPEPVKFIKIDIEGHEYSAFEGAKQLILKDKPLIWLEDHGDAATNFLKNLGYQILESSGIHDYLMHHPDNVWYK